MNRLPAWPAIVLAATVAAGAWPLHRLAVSRGSSDAADLVAVLVVVVAVLAGSILHQHRVGRAHRGRARSASLDELDEALAAQRTAALNLAEDAEGARREAERAARVLAAKSEELARSNRDLEQFAYVASHDLQEPLRMVSAYLQLLRKRYGERFDGEAREFFDFAVDGAKRMHVLIDDLLAYSRVGAQGRQFQPVDTERVLRDLSRRLDLTIAESGGSLHHERLPVVLADESQLGQLFQNLVANSLKFRGEEPVRIEIDATLEQDRWHFRVRDNGIGIDPRHFDRIFTIFQRLHTRESYPGTGIGLAICQRIVEGHGGTIWVESRPGHGATFHFTLPRHDHEGSHP